MNNSKPRLSLKLDSKFTGPIIMTSTNQYFFKHQVPLDFDMKFAEIKIVNF